MEKKRFFILTCMILAMCMGFVSCGNDDDDDSSDSSSIVGTWIDASNETTYVFNSDGTGSTSDESGSINFKYVYSSSDAGLQIWPLNTETVYYYSVSRTGNTLMLTRNSRTWILTKK